MEHKVIVYQRPNMFKVQDNLFNMVGYGELERMYTIEGYKTTSETLTLYYPERFLNSVEQRCLLERCEKAGFEEVTITTGDVYIIQTSKNVYVADVGELPEESSKIFKQSIDASGMPSDGGLNIL